MKKLLSMALTVVLSLGLTGCVIQIVQAPGTAGTPAGTLPALPPLAGVPAAPSTTATTGVAPLAPTTTVVPVPVPAPPPVTTTTTTAAPVPLPTPVATTTPPGGTGTTTAATTWQTVAPLISTNCVRCHPGFASESNFDPEKADAASRVAAGSMPQVGSPESTSISAADRATIEAYGNGQ